MSNYSRGRSLEYEIKSIFEQHGYSVIRGSSSKGKFAEMKPDLVASRFTDTQKRRVGIVLLQAKLERLVPHGKGKKKPLVLPVLPDDDIENEIALCEQEL